MYCEDIGDATDPACWCNDSVPHPETCSTPVQWVLLPQACNTPLRAGEWAGNQTCAVTPPTT